MPGCPREWDRRDRSKSGVWFSLYLAKKPLAVETSVRWTVLLQRGARIPCGFRISCFLVRSGVYLMSVRSTVRSWLIPGAVSVIF